MYEKNGKNITWPEKELRIFCNQYMTMKVRFSTEKIAKWTLKGYITGIIKWFSTLVRLSVGGNVYRLQSCCKETDYNVQRI